MRYNVGVRREGMDKMRRAKDVTEIAAITAVAVVFILYATEINTGIIVLKIVIQ